MKEKQLESLSALVDAEGEDMTMVDVICQESALQQKWARYHLIGDALRNNAPECLAKTTVARVQARLADEVTVFAPKQVPNVASPRWRQAAIAAGVAAVAVVGVVQMQEGTEVQQLGVAQMAGNTPLPIQTVSKNGHEIKRLIPRKQPRANINHYLAQHGAAASVPREARQVQVVTFPK